MDPLRRRRHCVLRRQHNRDVTGFGLEAALLAYRLLMVAKGWTWCARLISAATMSVSIVQGSALAHIPRGAHLAGVKLHPNREAPRCLPCGYQDPSMLPGDMCPGLEGFMPVQVQLNEQKYAGILEHFSSHHLNKIEGIPVAKS